MNGDLGREKQKSNEELNYLFRDCIEYSTMFSILEALCGIDKLENELTNR
jgi:hypothetical protein